MAFLSFNLCPIVLYKAGSGGGDFFYFLLVAYKPTTENYRELQSNYRATTEHYVIHCKQ